MAHAMRTQRRSRSLALCLCGCLLAPVASAEDADALKKQGDAAMVALHYEDALGHYKQAYELSGNPALLYNMGRAYEALAEYPAALEALEQFSEKAPADLRARVPKLEELVSDVRKRVSTLVFHSPAGAEVRVGGRVVGKTHEGQNRFRVNAGPKPVSVVHPDYLPFEAQATLPPGDVETLEVNLRSRRSEGLLIVRSRVEGAKVSVDGADLGAVPAEAVVKPGLHRVAIHRDGYDSTETSVVVSAGESRSVDLTMTRRETITGRWWFWTSIGVVLAAGGVATFIALTTEREADSGTIPPGRVKAELRF